MRLSTYLLFLAALTLSLSGCPTGDDDDDDVTDDDDVSSDDDCDPDDACDAVLASFAPCGGDVTGSWSIDTICMVWYDMGSNPDCPASTQMIGNTGGSGTVAFDGSQVSYTDYYYQPAGYATHSLACQLAGTTCQSLEDATAAAWTEACCSMIDADICECWAKSEQEAGDYTETYSTAANELTIGASVAEYCVDGDTLSIRSNGGTDNESVQVMTRQ